MNSAWIRSMCKGEKLQMFCFPYAGGGPHVFESWGPWLPAGVGLHAIHLPGRGRRLREPTLHQASLIADAIATELQPFQDLPSVFFGHSMGALLAFETARVLLDRGSAPPQWLFASAFRPPDNIGDREHIHELPEQAFIEKLRKLNGTPPEIFEHREMLDMVMPMLRADFAVIDSYEYRQGAPLPCSITAFCGAQDEYLAGHSMAGWRSQTSAGFQLQELPGGHFFIHTHTAQLLALIVADLEQLIGAQCP